MPSRADRPIVVISLITAACLIGDSMLYVVLPVHWQDMGLSSLWQTGIILSINRFVRLPLNPLVSHLYKTISARSGLLAAVVLTFISTAGYGLTDNFYLLSLLRCLWGLAWTFLQLGAYFTIINCTTNHGRSMGLYNGLYRLGSLVGMLCGGLMADAAGVRFTAVCFALVSLICIPFIFIYVRNTPSGMIAEHSKAEKDFVLSQNRSLLAILAVGACIAMIYQGMFNATLSYLIELHGIKAFALGQLTIGAAALGGMLMAVRWLWEPFIAPFIGTITDKHGRFPAFIAACAAAGLSFLFVPCNLPLAAWIGNIMLLQLTATVLTTLADSLAADAAVHSAKARVMTIYSLLVDAGAALGPLVAYGGNGCLHPYFSCFAAACLLFAITATYIYNRTVL